MLVLTLHTCSYVVCQLSQIAYIVVLYYAKLLFCASRNYSVIYSLSRVAFPHYAQKRSHCAIPQWFQALPVMPAKNTFHSKININSNTVNVIRVPRKSVAQHFCSATF